MWVIAVADVGDGDIKHIKDEWNHDREEGDARENGEQSQSSYKQQEHWQTKIKQFLVNQIKSRQ